MLPGYASVPSPSPVIVGWTISARWFRVLMTPSSCSSGWWESNSKYWSVCVGFLYTSMLRLLSSSMCTAQSKKGRLSPLTSSHVNLMLLSTALIFSVKASTSFALILTGVVLIPEPEPKSSSCEGNQGSALNIFLVPSKNYSELALNSDQKAWVTCLMFNSWSKGIWEQVKQ